MQKTEPAGGVAVRVEATVGLDVIGIVVEYLDREGFDGLYNPDGGCACKVGDLAPCGEIHGDCAAGYLQPCPDSCQEHDWHIGKERPNVEAEARR